CWLQSTQGCTHQYRFPPPDPGRCVLKPPRPPSLFVDKCTAFDNGGCDAPLGPPPLFRVNCYANAWRNCTAAAATSCCGLNLPKGLACSLDCWCASGNCTSGVCQ